MGKKRGRRRKLKNKGRPKKVRKVNDQEDDQLQSSRRNDGDNTIQKRGASSSPELLHSKHKKSCSDKTRYDVLDLKKFTSDLLAQSPINPDEDIIIFNNNNISEKNKVITTSHNLDNSTVDFNGYKVKGAMAPLLKSIFLKHGDIVKESTFSLESRSCILELVCTIYERLKASKLMQLKPLEMESMLGQIGDLELVNVKIRWLRKRLDLIVKAKEICDGASSVEEAEQRIVKAIAEKLKAVKSFEKMLKNGNADVEKLKRRIRDANDDVAVLDEVMSLFDGSLVDGLV